MYNNSQYTEVIVSKPSVMSIWSSINDMLLFLIKILNQYNKDQITHNQGHIKIIIINEPQYDPPWLRHCASISVPSITIFKCSIYHNEFLCMIGCDVVHTFPCDQCSQSAYGETPEHTRYLLVSLMRLSYIIKNPQMHHTTRFVSLPISLAITTYHWFVTHKHKTYCQSEHFA